MEQNGNSVKVESRPKGLTEKQLEKQAQIQEACRWKDVVALRALGSGEGGFITDELRRRAWPILLGYDDTSNDTKGGSVIGKAEHGPKTWESLPRHRDEDQVRLDVDRSFIWYPYGQNEKQLLERKQELSNLITEVLRRNPYLSYFQGYHDICQVFLLVLSPTSRTEAVSRLSALRIRDFMLPTLAPALAQLRLIPPILRAVNEKLYYHLSETQPFFALSPTLTMYAHDIQEYGEISRLFDVLLAQSPVFSVYMFAQIVLQRANELFETPADEPEMLHSILCKLPQPLNVEALIQNTITLFKQHPPESLDAWRYIPRYSVLKTARLVEDSVKQTMKDGEDFFEKQVKELAWIEKRQQVWKQVYHYRKPAGTIGVAVLVGMLAFYMRRPAASGVANVLWKALGGGAPGHY